MTSLRDRQNCIELIHEAVASGAALNRACSVLEVHQKTYRRWLKNGAVQEDGRPSATRPEPSNKLTVEERELIVTTSRGLIQSLAALSNSPETGGARCLHRV